MEVSWLHLLSLLFFCGAVICGLGGCWLSKLWVTATALGSILLAFLLGLSGFMNLINQGPSGTLHETWYSWFAVGRLHVDFGFMMDRLSGTLVLVITGVGFL